MNRIRADWLTDPRAQVVCSMLETAGFKAYFVGGCVRNALLGAPISDIDLATDAAPETVIGLAQDMGLKPIPTGVEHGTVTVVSSGLACEVTTFRTDVETDGRRAVVRFSTSIEEDAKRRDFTMNALYADASGHIIDPLNGLSDLTARRVRFIENAEDRIREDYLRILRFFRFHAWYGDAQGGLDPDGLAAISANAGGLETLSRERVGQELLKLLSAPNPALSVAAMQQVGVLAQILPGAAAAALPVLVHFEGETNTSPDPLRRLVSLGVGEDLKTALRLSRADAKRVSILKNLVGSTEGVWELAYRYGPNIACDVMLLRAALLTTPLPDDWEANLAYGANAQFPLKAAALGHEYEGPALGARLKQLETAWIKSGFTLTSKELLVWSK